MPRHAFLPEQPLARAYVNEAVATVCDSAGRSMSSVSQPEMQAAMLRRANLRPGGHVLKTDDRDRCRAAGIGDTVGFETKVVRAKAMVRRAIAKRIPFRWVTADAAYGFSKGWRTELERADVFHVMATMRHDTIVSRWGHGPSRPRPASRAAPAEMEAPFLR